MRTVTYEVFKFDELSEKAQEKAVQVIRDKDWASDFLSDDLMDTFKERLLEFGFTDKVKIEFSLNCCQGDGVAFYGQIDFDKWIVNNEDKFTPKELKRLKWLNNYELFYMDNGRNPFGYHYSHAYTMEPLVIDHLWSRALKGEIKLSEVMVKLQSILKEQIVSLSKELEKEGYEEVDFHNSDEYIRDMIIANEYEFTVDGSLF